MFWAQGECAGGDELVALLTCDNFHGAVGVRERGEGRQHEIGE